MLQNRAFLINLNFLTGMYYHTSGKFLETLDCDGLKTPLHNVVQWTINILFFNVHCG